MYCIVLYILSTFCNDTWHDVDTAWHRTMSWRTRILRMCVCEHVDVDVTQYKVHSIQHCTVTALYILYCMHVMHCIIHLHSDCNVLYCTDWTILYWLDCTVFPRIVMYWQHLTLIHALHNTSAQSYLQRTSCSSWIALYICKTLLAQYCIVLYRTVT